MKTRWMLLSTFYNNNAIKKEDIQLFFAIETSEYKNNTTNIPFLISFSQIKLTPCVNANLFIKNKMRTDILMQFILNKPFDKTNYKPSEFDIGIGLKQDISTLFSIYTVLAFPNHPSLSIGITKNIFSEFDLGIMLQLDKSNERKTQQTEGPDPDSKDIKKSKGLEEDYLIEDPFLIQNAEDQLPSYMRSTATSRAKHNNLQTQPKSMTQNIIKTGNYLKPTQSTINRENNSTGITTPRRRIKSTPLKHKNQNPSPQRIKTRSISHSSYTPSNSARNREPFNSSSRSVPLSSISPRRRRLSVISSYRSRSPSPFRSSLASTPNTSFKMNTSQQSYPNNRRYSSTSLLSSSAPLSPKPPLSPRRRDSRTSHDLSYQFSQLQNDLEQFRNTSRRSSPALSRSESPRNGSRRYSSLSISTLTDESPVNTNETHITEALHTAPKKLIKRRKAINPTSILHSKAHIKLVDELLAYMNFKTKSRAQNKIYTCDQTSTGKKYAIGELSIFRKKDLDKLNQLLNELNEESDNKKRRNLLLKICITPEGKGKDWTSILSTIMQQSLSNNLTKSNIKKWIQILEYLKINGHFHKKN